MKEAVIVSAVRTPLGSFNGSLGKIGATRLGAVVIEAVTAPHLLDLWDKNIEFKKWHQGRSEFVPTDPVMKMAQRYLARKEWQTHVLTGLIGAPTLRPDGSILDEPGYDEETGLYYYGARYYDARISMFYGVDPLMEKYSFQSPFAYAANNPVKFADLMGMGPVGTNGIIEINSSTGKVTKKKNTGDDVGQHTINIVNNKVETINQHKFQSSKKGAISNGDLLNTKAVKNKLLNDDNLSDDAKGNINAVYE